MVISAIDVHLKVISHFSKNQYLLVFHDCFPVMIFHKSFDMVLYLAFGFLMHLMTHELEARREFGGKLELERNGVVTRHQLWNTDNIAGVLEMQDFSLCFSLDLSLFLTSIDSVRFSVHPADLFSSLYLNHYLSGWCRHTNT